MRLASLATATLLALSAVPLAVLPASASAQPASCSLNITELSAATARVRIHCRAESPFSDRLTWIRLHGDDSFKDDTLMGCPPTGTLFTWTSDLDSEYLDEDLADTDEIYATVQFRRADGSTYWRGTRPVSGRYGSAAALLNPGKCGTPA
ncbi:hypothetical protein ACIBG7_10640 [Nonomuraea sp. NPDC050328]|uniref:hypothetical protein n=1 Tax=Nonomuraea sp. NPDC050328 TaxID=3364361 RepID=UPI0037BCCEC0